MDKVRAAPNRARKDSLNASIDKQKPYRRGSVAPACTKADFGALCGSHLTDHLVLAHWRSPENRILNTGRKAKEKLISKERALEVALVDSFVGCFSRTAKD